MVAVSSLMILVVAIVLWSVGMFVVAALLYSFGERERSTRHQL